MAKNKKHRMLTQNQKIRKEYNDNIWDADILVGVAMGRNTYPRSTYTYNSDLCVDFLKRDLNEAKLFPQAHKIYLLPPVNNIKPNQRQDLDETKVDIFNSFDDYQAYLQTPEFKAKYLNKKCVL